MCWGIAFKPFVALEWPEEMFAKEGIRWGIQKMADLMTDPVYKTIPNP